MEDSPKIAQWNEGKRLTPLTIRVPILVTNPLTLSDRNDDRASVEPGSMGASKATHSCRPLFRDAKLSCSRFRSHSSSQAYNASIFYIFRVNCGSRSTSESSSSLISCSWEMGGHTAADMMLALP